MKQLSKSLAAILLIFLGFPFQAIAASYIPYAFENTNWVKYRVAAWTNATDDPRLIKPSIVDETNSIERILVEFKSVSETVVTIAQKTIYRNSTETTAYYDIDIITGSGAPGIPLVLASGLRKGDYIYLQSLGSSPLRIEDTRTENEYMSYWREINVAYYQTGAEIGTLSEFYWDKQTGILCEMQSLTRNQTRFGLNDVVTYDVFWAMEISEIDSALWPEGETPILMFVFVGIAFLIVAFFLLRKMR